MLIDRKGKVFLVLAGESERILIPALPSERGDSRLRGLRLLHTHLSTQGLSQEDLMDLLFLRLDAIGCLCVDEKGFPNLFQYALLAPRESNPPYTLSPLLPYASCHLELSRLTSDIESDLAGLSGQKTVGYAHSAILISVDNVPWSVQENNLKELAALCKTNGIHVAATMIQRATRNAKVILGKGKIAELEVLALQKNANMIIFDGELTPAELHNLADITEREVLDRTQIILDIFARHAKSKAGKLQVELARLRYMQPRLVGKNTSLDRLMGGIGGKGKGETKLEYDRRRSKERVGRIREELEKLRKQRAYVRSRRKRNNLPLVAIVGYTNAGKSTLLNTLSHSHVDVEDKLFATLDPVTRRLRYPNEREVVFADTIGFIRNLPRELMEAFQATLEDLDAADLLLHAVDAHDPDMLSHISAVEQILETLHANLIPRLLVFTKWDCVDDEEKIVLMQRHPDAIAISCHTRCGIRELEARVLNMLEETCLTK